MNPVSIGLWLAKNRVSVFVGIIALIVLGYIGTLHWKLDNRDDTIVELNQTIVDKEATIVTEKGKVKVLEDNALAMVEAGNKVKENSLMWQKKYEDSTTKFQATIGKITKWKPKEGESDCEASKRIINDYRTNRVQSIPR